VNQLEGSLRERVRRLSRRQADLSALETALEPHYVGIDDRPRSGGLGRKD
jgi:hypothetical protein